MLLSLLSQQKENWRYQQGQGCCVGSLPPRLSVMPFSLESLGAWPKSVLGILEV